MSLRRLSTIGSLTASLVAGLILVTSQQAQAVKYGANYTPAGTPAPQGAPPPIGSGDTPTPEIQGDAAPGPLPSGTADPTNGVKKPAFGSRPETTRQGLPGNGIAPNNYVFPPFVTQPINGKDRKVVQDTTETGGDNAAVTNYPPSSTITKNGKDYKYIEKDRGLPLKRQNSPPFNVAPGMPLPGPLPIIRYFGRWIVLAGVVVATIKMIIAAWTVVSGHEKAGQRVLTTLVGLILLLMGFTIWKIVMINAYNSIDGEETEEATTVRANDTSALIRYNPMQPTLPLQASDTPMPQQPVPGGRPPRNPMPVSPLYGPYK